MIIATISINLSPSGRQSFMVLYPIAADLEFSVSVWISAGVYPNEGCGWDDGLGLGLSRIYTLNPDRYTLG